MQAAKSVARSEPPKANAVIHEVKSPSRWALVDRLWWEDGSDKNWLIHCRETGK